MWIHFYYWHMYSLSEILEKFQKNFAKYFFQVSSKFLWKNISNFSWVFRFCGIYYFSMNGKYGYLSITVPEVSILPNTRLGNTAIPYLLAWHESSELWHISKIERTASGNTFSGFRRIKCSCEPTHPQAELRTSIKRHSKLSTMLATCYSHQGDYIERILKNFVVNKILKKTLCITFGITLVLHASKNWHFGLMLAKSDFYSPLVKYDSS